jgi:hypothetical protein
VQARGRIRLEILLYPWLLFFSKRANDHLKPEVIVEGGDFIKKQGRRVAIGKAFSGWKFGWELHGCFWGLLTRGASDHEGQ